MTLARLAEIWRYPIKAHGRERLDEVALAVGQTLPWDRRWAVAHAEARIDGPGWAPCLNFSRGAKAPGLMAIRSRSDVGAGTLTLMHPDRPDLTLDPETDAEALMAWVAPLMPPGRAASRRIVRAEGRGMTDSDFASISLHGFASHHAVETRIGRPLSIGRWRGNLWIDGLEPWEEFEWVGREVEVGEAVLSVREPITRCLATAANPNTGQRDADLLGTLDSFGHRDFGVYAVVVRAGRVRAGDAVRPR